MTAFRALLGCCEAFHPHGATLTTRWLKITGEARTVWLLARNTATSTTRRGLLDCTARSARLHGEACSPMVIAQQRHTPPAEICSTMAIAIQRHTPPVEKCLPRPCEPRT